MPTGIYVLPEWSFEKIYGPEERRAIAGMVSIEERAYSPEEVAETPSLLADRELIFSGWGGPRIDADFLAAAPALKAVFYGAGSIKGIQSEAFWESGLPICSAWGANAVPVAEFAVSQIIFSLKRGWAHVFDGRGRRAWPRKQPVPGAYGTTVGLISLGMIGRLVARLLQSYELRVIAYDPYVKQQTAAELDLTLVDLETVFREGDVVSCHTPWLKETEGMLTGAHFALLPEDATFINTARGAVIREAEMIEVLQKRPDLYALLDVTYPEPPAEGSPLYTLPNVVLTPHIAGSMGRECRRMGQYMVEECRRFLEGEPLKWRVTREMFATMA